MYLHIYGQLIGVLTPYLHFALVWQKCVGINFRRYIASRSNTMLVIQNNQKLYSISDWDVSGICSCKSIKKVKKSLSGGVDPVTLGIQLATSGICDLKVGSGGWCCCYVGRILSVFWRQHGSVRFIKLWLSATARVFSECKWLYCILCINVSLTPTIHTVHFSSKILFFCLYPVHLNICNIELQKATYNHYI